MEKSNKSGLSNLLKFDDYKEYIANIIASESLPKDCKTPEAVFTKIAYGAELGFNPHQALHYLTLINGTNTVNAKGVGHLFKLHGYEFKCIKNADFIYSYGGKTIYSPRTLPLFDLLPLLEISKEDYNTFPDAKKILVANPVDRITTIEYWKKEKQLEIIKNSILKEVINKLKPLVSAEILFSVLNEIKTTEDLNTHSYYWSWAIQAGLIEKETYTKYPQDMMLHRCKVGLSKVLGILTQPETEEISRIHDIPYTEYS